MNVLVWYKRDLRVQDHPALSKAAALGPVLPIYIVEPDYWRLPDTAARHFAFLAEALADLRDQTARIGAPLVVRSGDAVEVLERMCRQHGIRHILSHEETGNGWTYARDRRVAAWARANGIVWEELPQSGVVRRLARRNGWQSQRDAFMAAPQLDTPPPRAPPGGEPGGIPQARALRLSDDPCPHRQRGGRGQGLDLLHSFLNTRGEPYRSAMSSPLSAERACSRLSPHIVLGSLSLREVVQATTARQDEPAAGRWGGALASFQSRLAWRDHFLQKLEDQPDIETRCLQAAAERLRPRHGDGLRLLSPLAGLARDGGNPCAAVYRLRAGDSLAAGADAIRHHRHEHAPHLQPRQTGLGPRPDRCLPPPLATRTGPRAGCLSAKPVAVVGGRIGAGAALSRTGGGCGHRPTRGTRCCLEPAPQTRRPRAGGRDHRASRLAQPPPHGAAQLRAVEP